MLSADMVPGVPVGFSLDPGSGMRLLVALERHQADGGVQTIATECERLKVDRRSIPKADLSECSTAQ